MSLPQYIGYEEGGTVFIDVSGLPTTATVAIEDGNGSEILSTTNATISTINTTLAANIDRGDMSFTVASNTGFEVGKTCWLQDDPEAVLIKKIEGTKIYTRRPIIYDHTAGAEVEGGRVTLDVNAATATDLFWDGRVIWNIDGTKNYTSIECTKYPLERLATSNDLADLEPKIYDVLDSESDVERLLDIGHQHVLKQIAVKAPDLRARVFVGSMAFKTATAYAALMIHYGRRGNDSAREQASYYEKMLNKEIDAVTITTPRDADQDEDIEESERMSMRTVKLYRG